MSSHLRTSVCLKILGQRGKSGDTFLVYFHPTLILILFMFNFTGIISCNGENSRSKAGGASGGSVMLITTNFSGKGKIIANGGIGKIILFYVILFLSMCHIHHLIYICNSVYY